MSDAGNAAASQIVVICPCCRETRTRGQIVFLQRQFERIYVGSPGEREAARLALETARNDLKPLCNPLSEQWACDFCLTGNAAIEASPLAQAGGTHPHFYAYFDRAFCCEDCRQETIFTKEEQKFWYEKLKFIRCSYPKRCRACRAARRARNLPKAKR